MKHLYAPANMRIENAQKVADVLQERLSTLIDLSLALKHIHWNVVGMSFISVHEMVDSQVDSVRDMVDAIAERIATLGGVPAGLAGQVVDMRDANQDYALGRAEVMAHLGALNKLYENVTAKHRDAIGAVADIDPISEDLLVGQSAELELAHWFVRAHLSNVDGRLATEDSNTQMDAAVAAASLRTSQRANGAPSPPSQIGALTGHIRRFRELFRSRSRSSADHRWRCSRNQSPAKSATTSRAPGSSNKCDDPGMISSLLTQSSNVLARSFN